MLEMLTIFGNTGDIIPPGEIIFSTPATSQSWTVPEGVTQISGVAISGGASGGGVSGGGGGGGGLLYFNNYIVTPGDVFSISIGPQATYQYQNGVAGASVTVRKNGVSIINVSGGSGGLRGSNGGNGGAGGVASALSDLEQNSDKVYKAVGQAGYKASGTTGGKGGSAARYDGQSMADNLAQSPFGIGGTSTSYGRGGAGGSNSNSSSSGELGCFRIMWGTGRTFPNNARTV